MIFARADFVNVRGASLVISRPAVGSSDSLGLIAFSKQLPWTDTVVSVTDLLSKAYPHDTERWYSPLACWVVASTDRHAKPGLSTRANAVGQFANDRFV